MFSPGRIQLVRGEGRVGSGLFLPSQTSKTFDTSPCGNPLSVWLSLATCHQSPHTACFTDTRGTLCLFEKFGSFFGIFPGGVGDPQATAHATPRPCTDRNRLQPPLGHPILLESVLRVVSLTWPIFSLLDCKCMCGGAGNGSEDLKYLNIHIDAGALVPTDTVDFRIKKHPPISLSPPT